MTRPHHAGEVSSCSAHECSRSVHVFEVALSPGVRLVCLCAGLAWPAGRMCAVRGLLSERCSHSSPLPRLSHPVEAAAHSNPRSARTSGSERMPTHGIASCALPSPRPSALSSQSAHSLLHCSHPPPCRLLHHSQCKEEGLQRLRPYAAEVCDGSEAAETV